ncbi:pentapeptide repeat-containing protein [Spiroplasma kunkelii]
MKRADLEGANLRGVYLSDADLTYAKLQDIVLRRADFFFF